jgi:hypothetical protein
MKLKQTIISIALLLSLSLNFVILPSTALADCAGTKTSLIDCPGGGGKTVDKTGLWALLLLIINIFSGLIGVAAVGGVVYGSILYSTAGGNMDKVKKARVTIAQTVLGIFVYVLLYAFLNYVIPGGLFK